MHGTGRAGGIHRPKEPGQNVPSAGARVFDAGLNLHLRERRARTGPASSRTGKIILAAGDFAGAGEKKLLAEGKNGIC